MKFFSGLKFWHESIAVAQRILIELFRRRRSLIFWSVFPISVLLLNGLILAERLKISTADAFAQAAPPTLVGAALFFSCVGGAVATVVAEREQRTLKRLFLSPLSGLSYFVGIFLAHCVIGFGQSLLLLALVLVLGGTFSGSLGFGSLVILLCILGYVGVGFLLGTQLARRTEDVNALVASFGVPLLILGGAFLPVRLFPKSLLNLAKLNPVYHMNEGLAGVLLSPTPWATSRPHLEFLALFSSLMVLAAWISYWSMVQVERRL